MTNRRKNFCSSIRIPVTWHRWIEELASNYGISTSQAYRDAVQAYMVSNGVPFASVPPNLKGLFNEGEAHANE